MRWNRKKPARIVLTAGRQGGEARLWIDGRDVSYQVSAVSFDVAVNEPNRVSVTFNAPTLDIVGEFDLEAIDND